MRYSQHEQQQHEQQQHQTQYNTSVQREETSTRRRKEERKGEGEYGRVEGVPLLWQMLWGEWSPSKSDLAALRKVNMLKRPSVVASPLLPSPPLAAQMSSSASPLFKGKERVHTTPPPSPSTVRREVLVVVPFEGRGGKRERRKDGGGGGEEGEGLSDTEIETGVTKWINTCAQHVQAGLHTLLSGESLLEFSASSSSSSSISSSSAPSPHMFGGEEIRAIKDVVQHAIATHPDKVPLSFSLSLTQKRTHSLPSLSTHNCVYVINRQHECPHTLGGKEKVKERREDTQLSQQKNTTNKTKRKPTSGEEDKECWR